MGVSRASAVGAFVRIRIFGIMGFTGFVRRVFCVRQALHPEFVLGGFWVMAKIAFCQNQDLRDYRIYRIRPARLIRNHLDRFSCYGENRNLGDNEILKIPPILKILILTNTRNPKPSMNRER